MDIPSFEPHTLSHPAQQHAPALGLIAATYDSLLLSLKLLSTSLKTAGGPARVYALALERDGGAGPGATMYVAAGRKRKPPVGASKVVAQLGGAPQQLQLVDQAVVDVGAAEAAAALGRGDQWVSHLHDRLAREAALQLYKKLDKDKEQSPWVSDRAPGVVCLGEDNGAVREMVKTVNARKDALKKAVQALKVTKRRDSTDGRHRLIADNIPAMRDTHLTQAYRHIQYIEEEVHRMTFGWSRSMRIVQFRHIGDVIAELEGYNQLDGEGKIERQLLEEDVPWLARVQSIPPFPIVNYWPLRRADSDGPRSIRCSAVMPILLRQAHLPPEFTPLTAFNPAMEPRARRPSAKLESTPAFVLKNTGISFYRYLPGVTPNPVKKAQAAAEAQAWD